ncbi:hypothetical protein EDD18DRAFT_1109967 [Armillaria luteobubalina]|uniref:Uncharacterized protein n=1 Tax=Armillaria luteobubalina TaxID=153913 RepID=A0AA39PSP3_9AGAR|nr:hypothetical protein EDD18DRAFT_1109967 [Armillaria luteobubalina]
MDSLQSAVVTLLAAVVAAPIFCVYLYRHGLIPGFLHPETDFWILLIGVSLIISLSPLVDCVGDLLSMGGSVHSLSPSWVESVCKISADLSELRTDNDLDVVSRAKLRQAFSRRAEISHLMAYAEKGIYSSNNLSAIDDQVAKLPLTEAAFRKSLERTLVSLHGSFMSIDRRVIEAGLLPESDAAPTSLPSYLPELHRRLEETADTHRATRNLSIALSDLCILSMCEKKSLETQMTTQPLVFTWMGINSANVEAVLYAISFMENLSHEVCAGWKAAILVGKQVHQFLLILEQSMHCIAPLRRRFQPVIYRPDIPNRTITVYAKQDASGCPLVTFEEVPIRVIGGNGFSQAKETRGALVLNSISRKTPDGPSLSPVPPVANGLTIRGPHFSNFPATRGNSQGQTVWYTSELPEDIALPPVINPAPPVGAVYIHRNTLSADAQIWCFDQNSVWKIIPSNNSSRFSHPNPDNSDRFFSPYERGSSELGHSCYLTEVSDRGRKKEGGRNNC